MGAWALETPPRIPTVAPPAKATLSAYLSGPSRCRPPAAMPAPPRAPILLPLTTTGGPTRPRASILLPLTTGGPARVLPVLGCRPGLAPAGARECWARGGEETSLPHIQKGPAAREWDRRPWLTRCLTSQRRQKTRRSPLKTTSPRPEALTLSELTTTILPRSACRSPRSACQRSKPLS